MLTKSIFLIFLQISLSLSICIIDENHCSKCNPITKLCVQCDKDIYTPDKEGGCEYSHKCVIGENQCIECKENEKSCQLCIQGYFPDENGGCSYTDNCEVSYRGECLKCKDDFILIGKKNFENEGIKICKPLNFGDLKNCEEINISNGLCEKCKEGFYLNSGDKKCSKIENCFESTLDVCKKCNKNFYLDKKESKCKNQTDIFEHCKQSLDGKTCDICDDYYYFDEEGKCIALNFCLKSLNEYRCEECAKGYIPCKYGTSCVTTENCYFGDSALGICTSCIEGYYIDYLDGKCKPNDKEDDFKHCRIADEGACIQCSDKWELSEDQKCTNTKHCAETDIDKCIACSDNYYLGLDNKCSKVEHCIYSNEYLCFECEGDYFYDIGFEKCIIGEGNLANCKYGHSTSSCHKCKDDFYLNETDKLCYSNKEGELYKCAKTDSKGDKCVECINGYNLGDIDKKCSTLEGCALSENENKCLECDLYYCLDAKTGQCVDNDVIEDDEKKFYFRCNKTDKEGNMCEICDSGYTLDKNGLCVDEEHCEEKNEDGICNKCLNSEEGIYCLNKDFGCVEIYSNAGCLSCNNNLEFENCTKCYDGFELNDNNDCEEIN